MGAGNSPRLSKRHAVTLLMPMTSGKYFRWTSSARAS
jgi:hypothetical protein